MENFLLRVGRTRHAVRRIESPEMASAKAFGGQLFNGVFTGDVQGCLRSSLDEASRQGAGLRVRLHLTKVLRGKDWMIYDIKHHSATPNTVGCH